MIIRDISRFTMYIDETFNRLTVLNVYYNGSNVHAICKCSCGNIVSKRLYDVTHGIIKSCGCLNSEVRRATAITRSTTHNLSKSPLYPIWCTMHARCYNKNNEHFHRYGARGIYICDEWKRRKNSKKNGNPSFMNFYNWAMKNGYKPGLSIDRINNDGPYAPLHRGQYVDKDGFLVLIPTNYYKGELQCID